MSESESSTQAGPKPIPQMKPEDVIYIAGGETMVGQALLRRLAEKGFTKLLGYSGQEPNLGDPTGVEKFFARNKPAYVFMVAGRNAGIAGNQKSPATLIYDNLMVSTNVIHSAHQHRATRLLYLASSCCYPRSCPQPMAVENLMTGPLEPTNEAYAMAKLAGIKLCQAYHKQYSHDFIVGIPANPFGVADDFSPRDSHVIAGLIQRMQTAKQKKEKTFAAWGTGKARREFIFADDLADACIFLMQNYRGPEPINIGGGEAVSIAELANMVKQVVGYEGELLFDTARPDGMPLKSLDSGPLAKLGWKPLTPLKKAIELTYQSYLNRVNK